MQEEEGGLEDAGGDANPYAANMESEDEDEAADDKSNDDSKWQCKKCGQSNDDANLLMCDACDIAWHTYCLEVKLGT